MNTPRKNDDCEALAPFVMALFDGEADELEARRARAHLLVCQRCARRWLDWNRSRDLLRAVPVPAPPPTLLWRVLMACRLAAFARKRRLGLGDSLGFAAPRAQPTGSDFAPPALSAQILARTTRAALPPSHQPKPRVFPIFALPSLAVPALAIWLIALGGNTPWVSPSLETPLPNTSEPRRAQPVAPPTSPAAPRRAAVSPPRKLAVSPTASAPESPAPQRAATRVEVALAPLQFPQPEVKTAPVAPQPVVRAAPRVVAVAFPPAPASPRPAAARPVATLRVAPPRARLVVLTPQLSSPRLTALSASPKAPQLRASRWKISTPPEDAAVELAASGAIPSRVSPPTAPAPAPPLLLAENFEADDEESVEEMRSVVDDFRAALAPDGFQTIDFESDAG